MTQPCPNCGGPTIDDGWTPVFCGQCGNIDKYEGRSNMPTSCPNCEGYNTYPRTSMDMNHTFGCDDCGETFRPGRKGTQGGEARMNHDPVNHPQWYTGHPSGVECIEISRELGFDLGNAFKYVWRHELKDKNQALEKALWYITDAWERRAHPVDPWVADKMAMVLAFEKDADKGLALYYIMRAICYPGEYHASLTKAHDTIRRMIDAYTQAAPS